MKNTIGHLKARLLSHFYMMNKYIALNNKRTIRELQQQYDPGSKRLIRYGYKIYSKNEEDGLIHEIFSRIGTTNKTFVEIGVDDGLENNTLALLFENWKGLWIEGSKENVQKITHGFSKTIARGQLTIIHSFVTRDKINALLSANLREKIIDLLVIDVDGNDFHIFDAISCVESRVIVIEYNGKFPPPILYCMQYNENHIWDGSDYFGASLKYLEVKMKEKGYSLVGCNLTGGNAFFVKDDLAKDLFEAPYNAENHYEPARYELTGYIAGHRPSYKTLENREIIGQ